MSGLSGKAFTAVKIANYSIFVITNVSIKKLIGILNSWLADGTSFNGQTEIVEPIVREIIKYLELLTNVGLDYLTLSRNAATLSGGEAQ